MRREKNGMQPHICEMRKPVAARRPLASGTVEVKMVGFLVQRSAAWANLSYPMRSSTAPGHQPVNSAEMILLRQRAATRTRGRASCRQLRFSLDSMIRIASELFCTFSALGGACVVRARTGGIHSGGGGGEAGGGAEGAEGIAFIEGRVTTLMGKCQWIKQ